MGTVWVVAATIAAGLIGIVPAIPGVLPERPTEPQTTVKIGTGLYTKTKTVDMGGVKPAITIFDVQGARIGDWGPGNNDRKPEEVIAAGATRAITVNHYKGLSGIDTEYIAINNVDGDPICINYIAVATPKGLQWMWTGDVAQICDLPDWFYSDITVGDGKDADISNTPSCVWLAKDRREGIRYQAMGMHILDFSLTPEKAKQWQNDKRMMCNSDPRFKMYERMDFEDWIPAFLPKLEYTSKGEDMDPAKIFVPGVNKDPRMSTKLVKRRAQPHRARSPPPRSAFMKGTLVQSNRPHHSAEKLCQSENSLGPDFVSTSEKLFCDMSEKTLWPFCESQDSHDCFDLQKKNIASRLGASTCSTCWV